MIKELIKKNIIDFNVSKYSKQVFFTEIFIKDNAKIL